MYVSGWHTKATRRTLAHIAVVTVSNLEHGCDATAHALRILDASAPMPLPPIALLFRDVSAAS